MARSFEDYFWGRQEWGVRREEMHLFASLTLGKAGTTTLRSDFSAWSYWLRAAAAEPIGLGQTKGYIYNRVFPAPFSGLRRVGQAAAPHKGDALLQGVPSCKNSPPDCFCNSPLAERAKHRISQPAGCDEGLLAPRPPRPFEKGRRKLFNFPLSNPLTAARRCAIITLAPILRQQAPVSA